MAFLRDEEDTELQNGQNSGQTTPNPSAEVPPQTSGSSGEGTGSQAGAAPSMGTSTQFGSSASKLGDYLTANAPQIGQQADKVAGQLNQSFADTNKAVSDSASAFNQQVQGGYKAANKDVVDQAAADPTKFAQDQNNLTAFRDQFNNAYTGPQTYESTGGYGDTLGKVQKATTQANLLKSEGGLQSYLQGQAKNPAQSLSTLDALLLRGDPAARQKVQDAAGQFGTLNDTFGQSVTGANQSVQAAQDAAQAAQNYARDAFTGDAGVLPTWQKDLQNRTAQNEAQRTQYNQDLLPKQNQVRDILQLFNNFGSQVGGDFSTGGALDKYLGYSPVPNPATLENSATQDDFQKQDALQALLGDSFNGTSLDEFRAGEAGSFNLPQDQVFPSDWHDILAPIARNAVSAGLGKPGNLHPKNKEIFNLLQSLNNYSHLTDLNGSPESGRYGWGAI